MIFPGKFNESRSQELFSGRVGKPQSPACQPKAARLDQPPTPLHESIHIGRPFLAQLEAGRLSELLEGPSGVHPQTECRRLARPRQWRQLFGPFDRASPPLELFAVKDRVRPVFCPDAVHVAGGGRSQPVKLAAPPVIDVVAAGMVRKVSPTSAKVPRAIGDFVLVKAVLLAALDQFL